MNNQPIYINRYLPIAILYFFLNEVFLPPGLLYTALLTPVLLIWLARYPTIRYLTIFFVFTVPFVLIHLINGVNYPYYIRSLVLFFSVFVFGLAFYRFLSNCHSLKSVYKSILLINAAMVIISVIIFFIPFLKPQFWYSNEITTGFARISRLKMLTYEPSYYSTLFAPIVCFYLLKLTRAELPQPVLYGALVLVPLFLSLSFGVILGIAISLVLLLVIRSRDLIFKGKNLWYILGGVIALMTGLTILYLYDPNNVFFVRIANVLFGKDTSFKGRTFDSFYLSWKIAGMRSHLFGAGLGQVKLLGLDLFKAYYNYQSFTINTIGIPNSIGDTLAIFGLAGLIIKLFFEAWFFFKTKVFRNDYRLVLFMFIFIYQFTGSFIMNIAEYTIWILAFKEGLFPEFDRPFVKNHPGSLPVPQD